MTRTYNNSSFRKGLGQIARKKDITKLISENIKNPVIVNLDIPDENIAQFDSIDDNIQKLLIASMNGFYNDKNKFKEKKIDEMNSLTYARRQTA